MKYSFVGLSKPATAVNRIIKSAVREYVNANPGKDIPLEPGGVCTGNITNGSVFAGENDMAVYLDYIELIENSDIIFIFLPDSSLKKFVSMLVKYDIRGKIFCHANVSACSDILDFSSLNTYCSFFFAENTDERNYSHKNQSIIMEGYGKNYELFKKVLSDVGINCIYLTADEKRLYFTGVNFIRDFSRILTEKGKKLVKISLASAPGAYDELINKIDTDGDSVISYDPIENEDYNYIKKQGELLKSVGLDDVTRIFEALTQTDT